MPSTHDLFLEESFHFMNGVLNLKEKKKVTEESTIRGTLSNNFTSAIDKSNLLTKLLFHFIIRKSVYIFNQIPT